MCQFLLVLQVEENTFFFFKLQSSTKNFNVYRVKETQTKVLREDVKKACILFLK